MTQWSYSKAQTLHGYLTVLLRKVPSITNIKDAGTQETEDYKVFFHCPSLSPSTFGFYLRYKPDEQTLVAWASGFIHQFPEAVKKHLDSLFDGAEYEHTTDVGVDGFHYWRNISWDELRIAATRK